MATRIQKYRIAGRVIDRVSRKGVQGVRVEGWDRDKIYHDMLGSAITGADGAFSFTFDSTYFGDHAPDRAPDLFFKVYLDDRLIKNTFDTPMTNQPPGDVAVTLEIDYGEAAPAGKDRITTEHMLKTVRFMQQSDFAGIWRETRDKATTVGKFVGALGVNAFAKFDLEPIGVTGTRTNEVVGQDVTTAQRNLAANQVQVAEVKDYSPQVDRASVRAIADFPVALKPGDTVTLYQQDGKVQYYSIVKPVEPKRVDAQQVARIDQQVQTLKSDVVQVGAVRADLETVKASASETSTRLETSLTTVKAQQQEVARLKAELAAVQQSAAGKDAQIQKLQADVATMQAAQRDINARFSPDKLAALELQVQKLSERTPRAGPQHAEPGARARPKPAPKAKKKNR